MARTMEKDERIQAILRLPPDLYSSLRNAAKRARMSFNTFAVETLTQVIKPSPTRIDRDALKPDPILDSLVVDSFGLSAEDLADKPRIAKLLAE